MPVGKAAAEQRGVERRLLLSGSGSTRARRVDVSATESQQVGQGHTAIAKARPRSGIPSGHRPRTGRAFRGTVNHTAVHELAGSGTRRQVPRGRHQAPNVALSYCLRVTQAHRRRRRWGSVDSDIADRCWPRWG
jgi:hypothetical protein